VRQRGVARSRSNAEIDHGLVEKASAPARSPGRRYRDTEGHSQWTRPGAECRGKAPNRAASVVHHDRSEAEQARLADCFRRCEPVDSFFLIAKSTIMMPFFFTTSNQQNDPDHADDGEILTEEHMDNNAPSPANGKVEMIVNGWMKTLVEDTQDECTPPITAARISQGWLRTSLGKA